MKNLLRENMRRFGTKNLPADELYENYDKDNNILYLNRVKDAIASNGKFEIDADLNEAKEKFKVIDTKTGDIIDSDLPKNIAQKLAKKKKEWTSYPDRKESAIAKIAQTLDDEFYSDLTDPAGVDIMVNYVEVDLNYSNMSIQNSGVLDSQFVEETLGDIEAYIEDNNTRIVSDIKFDCSININNDEIDITLMLDTDGDVISIDIQDDDIADNYGINDQWIQEYLSKQGL